MIKGLMLALQVGDLLIKTAQGFSQQKAENVRSQMEIDNARRAGAFDLSALADQLYQTKQATDLQIFERSRQSLRDQSRLLVSAGEAGVGGNSVLRQLANQEWDRAFDVGIHQTNLENQAYTTSQHARAVASNMDSRVNTASARMKNPWTQTALQIPALAYSGYQAYTGLKGGGK